MIYEFICSRGKLSTEHKKQLKEKRGFTDKTIKENRFFSGGKYLLALEPELLSNFSEDDLLRSGIFLKNDKEEVHISPMLLEDRVIIPYLNQGGKAYFLRPHKLGLKEVEIQIYQEKNIDKELILTEGEFKAAAGVQLGFNAIAIPGVGSFSDKHLPRLKKFIHDNKVQKITIMFDNEIKDDPNLPNYKPSPMDRWDTQYYSFLMAKILEKEGIHTRIAILPDGWMENGKIDIDGALAQGRTKADLARVISRGVTANEYFNELSKEAQTVIQKKQKKRYFKSNIRKEFGKYIATRRRGKHEIDEVISNFTIKILATHETSEGIIREVQFINEHGEASRSFSLTAESMVRPDGFSSFCANKGNFFWRGNKDDLMNIWEWQCLDDDGRHIVEPDHIGWIETEKMWMFGNVAIKDIAELRPDENHIFWTEKRGLKPISLAVASGRNMVSEGVPHLRLTPFKIDVARDKFSDTLGVMEACLCLGWISAVIWMEEIFNKYGCFPFLFITGKKGAGKSLIAEWLMNFYGLENCGKQAADTTSVGLQRYLAYYSSLPVFLDEYRNVKQITMKNGMLRNVYNRQSAGKGIKSDFGVREARIRGTLIIAGEETPEDNALLTRCIVVYVSLKNRKINHFDWFMANRMKFSNHILELLRNKKSLTERFMRVLEEGKEVMVQNGADDRTAINYAIAAAGYAVVFGEEDIQFAKWIVTESKRAKEDYQGEHAVEVFLDDLISLKIRKQINDHYWMVWDGKIFIYFHGLYVAWSQDYRKTRGIEPFKESAIRDYLKEFDSYLEGGMLQRIGGVAVRCMVFDMETAPEQLKMLVETVTVGGVTNE